MATAAFQPGPVRLPGLGCVVGPGDPDKLMRAYYSIGAANFKPHDDLQVTQTVGMNRDPPAVRQPSADVSQSVPYMGSRRPATTRSQAGSSNGLVAVRPGQLGTAAAATPAAWRDARQGAWRHQVSAASQAPEQAQALTRRRGWLSPELRSHSDSHLPSCVGKRLLGTVDRDRDDPDFVSL
jgi:hypothetical protein